MMLSQEGRGMGVLSQEGRGMGVHKIRQKSHKFLQKYNKLEN